MCELTRNSCNAISVVKKSNLCCEQKIEQENGEKKLVTGVVAENANNKGRFIATSTEYLLFFTQVK